MANAALSHTHIHTLSLSLRHMANAIIAKGPQTHVPAWIFLTPEFPQAATPKLDYHAMRIEPCINLSMSFKFLGFYRVRIYTLKCS